MPAVRTSEKHRSDPMRRLSLQALWPAPVPSGCANNTPNPFLIPEHFARRALFENARGWHASLTRPDALLEMMQRRSRPSTRYEVCPHPQYDVSEKTQADSVRRMAEMFELQRPSGHGSCNLEPTRTLDENDPASDEEPLSYIACVGVAARFRFGADCVDNRLLRNRSSSRRVQSRVVSPNRGGACSSQIQSHFSAEQSSS